MLALLVLIHLAHIQSIWASIQNMQKTLCQKRAPTMWMISHHIQTIPLNHKLLIKEALSYRDTKWGNQMLCSHCGTLLPPLVTKVDSGTFLHPQPKTTLNRCISYDTLPLNTREFLKTFGVTKQDNEYYDKGLTIPPHCGKHATLAKHKQEVAAIPTGF